jgi:hypothetical protein
VKVFRGTRGSDGEEVQLVQHVSQVNLLLVPLKVKGRQAHRIGFDVEQPAPDSDGKP